MNKYQEALSELSNQFSDDQAIAIDCFIDFCLDQHQAEIDSLQKQVDALENRLDNI